MSAEQSAEHAHAAREQVQRASERGRARVSRAMEQLLAQQRQAAQAFASQAMDDAPIVSPAAMAWTRALVEQGPITVGQAASHQAAEEEPTGIEQFDDEQRIANDNAASIQPYIQAALGRLRALENPPVTQQDCDELREQLELYHQEPEAYGIQYAAGEHAPLQTQTFRAYSEALASADQIHGPTELSRHLNHRFGFSTREVDTVAAQPNGEHNLQAMSELTPALSGAGLGLHEIARIAAHSTGDRNMQAVADLVEPLRALGFTTRQVARMAARRDGFENVQAAAEHTPALRARGLRPLDIFRLVDRQFGAESLAYQASLPDPAQQRPD